MRTLSRIGWAVMAVVLIMIAILAGRGVGLRWDPLNLNGRRLEAARTKADAATADAAARRLEVEGGVRGQLAVDRLHQQALAVERVTAQAIAQTRTVHDAQEPLDPDRADRLHAHDRQLCRITPDVCDGSAPATPSGRRNDALPAGSAG